MAKRPDLVRFCAVVRFLCAYRPTSTPLSAFTLTSSSATTSPLHIVGLPSFTQPPYGLDVFPEHAAEGFTTTTTGIPVLNSLGLRYRPLSSIHPPPAHHGHASTGSPRTLLCAHRNRVNDLATICISTSGQYFDR
jgi:hypothetical protein